MGAVRRYAVTYIPGRAAPGPVALAFDPSTVLARRRIEAVRLDGLLARIEAGAADLGVWCCALVAVDDGAKPPAGFDLATAYLVYNAPGEPFR